MYELSECNDFSNETDEIHPRQIGEIISFVGANLLFG